VYAVWFNMYPGDARSKWPSTVLADPRVSHYWDDQRTVGRLYLSRVPAMLNRRAAATRQPADDALWDAFFLYAPGDRWQDPLPLPVRWGYPIMVTRDQLLRDVDARIPRADAPGGAPPR
jgi:hypothetical protein